MKFKLLFLSIFTIAQLSECNDIFDRVVSPSERKEFMNNVGIGSSTSVWEEVSSMYSRTVKYGVDTIRPNELALTAKHAGQSPYAPVVVIGGSVISLFLGVNTLRHGLYTIADLLLLRGSFVKEFGKTLVWGSGTAIVLVPTVIAGYTIFVAFGDSKRK